MTQSLPGAPVRIHACKCRMQTQDHALMIRFLTPSGCAEHWHFASLHICLSVVEHEVLDS